MAKSTETRGPSVEFSIEADHHRNSDLLIQSIPNCRLRSALVATRHIRGKDGKEYVPVDQVRHLSMFGRIPGMRLHVDSKELKYTITDPLFDDDQLCAHITATIRANTGMSTGQNIGGVPPVTGALGRDEIKTLCRELRRIVTNGDAKIVGNGRLPEEDEIDALPGDYLLNPGSRITNTQPRYEKDWDNWISNLSRAGG